MKRYLGLAGLCLLAVLVGAEPAFAESAGGSDGLSRLASALAIGVAALGGTLGQARAVSAGLDAIGRNPSAAGKLQTPLIIGLVFMESLVILSFVIALG